MSQTRRLAAILAADVAGYSRLMGADEEGTLQRLKALRRELLDPKLAEHKGRIVKTTGDGLLLEFASVVDAVRCAVEVQQAMPERNTSFGADNRIELRVGINLGDIIIDEGDIYGDGVNIAARIEALADAGGVLVSNTVYENVRDRLPFVFEDLGEQQVKNIARPVRVYRVRLEGALPNPSPQAGEGRVRVIGAPALPLPDKPSIAVLPFTNLSGDPEQEYFADGMVEEIITALSRIRWLFVIARNSSFTYKGQAVDVKQVGRELGVRYVLEGSVRKASGRVRITGQLIDTASGAHLWADRFDGSLDDVFDLQDKVASSVVGSIEPRLRYSEIERAGRKPTGSLDAYDIYLQALARFHRLTEGGMREAVALLRRAYEIDPLYAPAAALIGWCHVFRRAQVWEPVSDEDISEGVHLAREAIQASNDGSEALWMAALTLSRLSGEHALAAATIDRALLLNPNSAHAWMASGYVSCSRNLPDLAVEAFQRAMRLSPLDPLGWLIKSGVAFAHLIAGRFEQALDWADRCFYEQPRFSATIRFKVVSYAHLERLDEARDWLKRLLELEPDLTISRWTSYAVRAFSPETVLIYAEGLRKAGLPEE
jgi:TolB-like protein/class 3 adenylate cyclase/tetratricopeptide (TPR) repeat protein